MHAATGQVVKCSLNDKSEFKADNMTPSVTATITPPYSNAELSLKMLLVMLCVAMTPLLAPALLLVKVAPLILK